MTLRTLNYGNYGIFLIMGNAGFCPSTVVSIEGLGAKGAGMLGGGGGYCPNSQGRQEGSEVPPLGG